MKIIISPAKKIITEKNFIKNATAITFNDEAKYLVKELQSYSILDLKELMSLSEKLAILNHERFKKWNLRSENINPAIYMFKGDVYKGLKAENFSEDDIKFTQDNLRIISGLYGILKPLDLVFPYRLEMSTNLKTTKGNNLYEFWGNKLNKALKSEMKDKEVIINLASNEYSKALKLGSINQPIITPIFKDYKNGKFKVISLFAKRARGEMCNFIIKNKIKNSEDIKLFDNNGYKFSDEINGEIIFCR